VSVEFMLLGKCPMISKFGESRMMEASKLEAIIEGLRSCAPKPLSRPRFRKLTFMRQLATPEGTTQRETSVAEVERELAPIRKLRRYCKGCRFNVIQKSLSEERFAGCCGSVHYPLSAASERWVARSADHILQVGLDDSHGLLLRFIDDHPAVGNRVTAMRGQGGAFFELESRFELRARGKEYNTDQLWEMLLGFNITPIYAKAVYAPFFEAMQALLNSSPGPERYSLHEDRTVLELRIFGNACRLSAMEDVPMVVAM
jgi:hypothetical protein